MIEIQFKLERVGINSSLKITKIPFNIQFYSLLQTLKKAPLPTMTMGS